MNLDLDTSLQHKIYRINLIRTHRLSHLNPIQNEVLALQFVHDLFETLRPWHFCSI